ncbi:hypothetical protein [Bacillus atrophaeus]|uniref:hypothetical protein n=1 Tax=Bacillus atrophaeus TaxID=1452 RepID=UPI00255C04B7|nr:hypothetical protein [Bacillus atrophaeus]MDL5141680.1 hypothetical protein [Bacillus atrophaeus]
MSSKKDVNLEQWLDNETKTWNIENGVCTETPMENLLFLKDVEGVCKWHNMTFSHEEIAMELYYSRENMKWLASAMDGRGKGTKDIKF